MKLIETKKPLPELERGYQRALLQLQGEFMGQRIDCAAWVDYEVLGVRSLHIEAEDINVIAIWSEAGADMLDGYTGDTTGVMNRYDYLIGCAMRAAAGHEYALEVEDLEASRDRRTERMLTGVL